MIDRPAANISRTLRVKTSSTILYGNEGGIGK
jgi:hypothetical protein